MEWVGLGISLVALLIALYGIYERQRAAYSAMRVRLTELLGTMEDAKLEEFRYGEEHDDEGKPEWARLGFVSRRALLTYQAVDLAQRLDTASRWPFGPALALTPSEYGSLAYALQWCGDFGESERYWRKSLATRGFVSSYVSAANHRGYAALLFELSQSERARSHYEQAIADASGPTGAQRWDVFQTYLSWIQHEKELLDSGGDGIPDDVVDRARAFAATDDRWGPMMLMEISKSATTTVFADGEYRGRQYGSATS